MAETRPAFTDKEAQAIAASILQRRDCRLQSELDNMSLDDRLESFKRVRLTLHAAYKNEMIALCPRYKVEQSA